MIKRREKREERRAEGNGECRLRVFHYFCVKGLPAAAAAVAAAGLMMIGTQSNIILHEDAVLIMFLDRRGNGKLIRCMKYKNKREPTPLRRYQPVQYSLLLLLLPYYDYLDLL